MEPEKKTGADAFFDAVADETKPAETPAAIPPTPPALPEVPRVKRAYTRREKPADGPGIVVGHNFKAQAAVPAVPERVTASDVTKEKPRKARKAPRKAPRKARKVKPRKVARKARKATRKAPRLTRKGTRRVLPPRTLAKLIRKIAGTPAHWLAPLFVVKRKPTKGKRKVSKRKTK